MATSVKFLNFRPCTFGNLRPAPNATESEAIHAAVMADTTPRIPITPNDLQDKNLMIIVSYRSSLLWLEGGVVIYRHDPKTEGGAGYAGWPTKDLVEEVTVGDKWIAEVQFV
jgi:hypothetical protein